MASEKNCAYCDAPLPAAAGPGRPRRYCSDVCRFRAARAATARTSAANTDDALAQILDSPTLTRRVLAELTDRIATGQVDNDVIAAVLAAHNAIVQRVSVTNRLHDAGSGIKPSEATHRSRRPARPSQ